MDVIAEIENAFVGHWSLFGSWPKGELHDEQGVLWFETPIRHLPYNGVIRTRIDGDAGTAVWASLEAYARLTADCWEDSEDGVALVADLH